MGLALATSVHGHKQLDLPDAQNNKQLCTFLIIISETLLLRFGN